ncbi:MAG: hypothetical protein ACRD4U_04290 [Candidatus Acidiferrales bacterium]
MRFGLGRVFGGTALALLALAAPAAAQEMKISQLRMLPDGQMIWSAGESVSKAGVRIPFDSHMVNDQFAGYKLASAEAETLQKDDSVLLYFRGLKVSGDPMRGWRDATGAKVFGDSEGAWRAVTIESVAREGERVTIAFSEELTLKDEQKIKQLQLAVVEGYLLPAVPGASAPAKKPSAAPPAAPTPAPAPAKEGPVRVSAEAILNAQEEVVGYKYTESLAAAGPGDTIPVFIRGLDEGPSSGAFKHLTVKAIERTGNRLRIDFEEELTLANGQKLNSMRFALRQGYWFVVPARPPAAKKP